jgi:hypothetical protein
MSAEVESVQRECKMVVASRGSELWQLRERFEQALS